MIRTVLLVSGSPETANDRAKIIIDKYLKAGINFRTLNDLTEELAMLRETEGTPFYFPRRAR